MHPNGSLWPKFFKIPDVPNAFMQHDTLGTGDDDGRVRSALKRVDLKAKKRL
jgi:hypothetical protein